MKVLNIQLNKCKECPYCQYEGWSHPAFYCNNPDPPALGKRIVVDIDEDNDNFHSPELYPVLNSFPNWCPLPDKVNL